MTVPALVTRPAGAAALAAALLLAPAHTPAARAYDFCRSDPAVLLSDGATVDLSAAIADSLADVQGVSYTLHTPPGTFVVAWAGTDGLMGLKETFRSIADAPTGTYASTTVVTTTATPVGVVAMAQLVAVGVSATVRPLGADAGAGVALPSGSATGSDRQPLRVTLASASS